MCRTKEKTNSNEEGGRGKYTSYWSVSSSSSAAISDQDDCLPIFIDEEAIYELEPTRAEKKLVDNILKCFTRQSRISSSSYEKKKKGQKNGNGGGGTETDEEKEVDTYCPYCDCEITKLNYDTHVESCARSLGFVESDEKNEDISKLQQKNVLTRREKSALRKRGLLDETLQDENDHSELVKKKRKIQRKDRKCT